MSYESSISDLRRMVGKNEQIFWRGKPNKVCYILEGIFNPLLPFAIVWLLVDSSIMLSASQSTNGASLDLGLLLFFMFHLMPVWIYLCGVLFVYRRYKHTEYIVTNKGIYVSGGLFSYSCEMKPFAELSRVNIHRGIIDQILGVGDVVLTSSLIPDFMAKNTPTSSKIGLTIEDINEYRQVFDLIKKLQEDIYTDTMYPNDLRPVENHGYKTEYKSRGSLDI